MVVRPIIAFGIAASCGLLVWLLLVLLSDRFTTWRAPEKATDGGEKRQTRHESGVAREFRRRGRASAGHPRTKSSRDCRNAVGKQARTAKSSRNEVKSEPKRVVTRSTRVLDHSATVVCSVPSSVARIRRPALQTAAPGAGSVTFTRSSTATPLAPRCHVAVGIRVRGGVGFATLWSPGPDPAVNPFGPVSPAVSAAALAAALGAGAVGETVWLPGIRSCSTSSTTAYESPAAETSTVLTDEDKDKDKGIVVRTTLGTHCREYTANTQVRGGASLLETRQRGFGHA